MTKPITLGGLLASLFPKSNRALSEKLSTEEFNELTEDVQAIQGRLDTEATAPPSPTTLEAGDVQVDDKKQEVPPANEESAAADPEPEASQETQEDPEPETPLEEAALAGVQMESIASQELAQLRADAGAWNKTKAEYGVLKSWYEHATSEIGAGSSADAVDVGPAETKSWQKAPWNN
ncbi:hypothetical protein [Arundinibacter roseus]|uniref:Uncharacterized protein n=1 Tax=Arundinibacter roseus TaxID=2070510 RepID=A0A4R4K159_9BACT|nr:hypothetical protein [Arundinibacter roseus]TDB60081.1 hypothetical protein EZE20_21660 [Arundinibacter roseus]